MKKTFKFLINVCLMFIVALAGGGYASAATEGALDGGAVQDLGNGGGNAVGGDATVTKIEQVQDAEWYLKQINKTIVEMKFTGTPIDQILRNASFNKSDSIVVKYYSVGQRPLVAKVKETFSTNGDNPGQITLENDAVLGAMDTLLVMKADGSFVKGYVPGTNTEDDLHPLMLRVNSINTDTNKPMVYAVNGKQTDSGKAFAVPQLEPGTILLRMGRAAAEKDVQTGRYFILPEPTEQYCQRFIMQVEQSVYDRFSKTEVEWAFTRVERMAMEDMRIGMEASGLFGIKGKHIFNEKGNIYTCEGIWYRAGKDLMLGHWEKVLDAAGKPIVDEDGNYVQEYVITEDELVDLVARIIDGAGNGSRRKMVFVDNTIYAALCKIRTKNRVRVFEPANNYLNTGLDFQAFESMGTKLLFYRHDLFNAWGFNGRAFCLDPEYLDKWVFQNWERHEYDLKKLFVSNSNAVTMEEFSCWTLGFPDAHARIAIPEYVAEKAAA